MMKITILRRVKVSKSREGGTEVVTSWTDDINAWEPWFQLAFAFLKNAQLYINSTLITHHFVLASFSCYFSGFVVPMLCVWCSFVCGRKVEESKSARGLPPAPHKFGVFFQRTPHTGVDTIRSKTSRGGSTAIFRFFEKKNYNIPLRTISFFATKKKL